MDTKNPGSAMNDIQKTVPITKAKRDFLDLISEIAEEDSTVAVTKNGIPVSVMMTHDRYEALLETIEILASPRVLKALKSSKRDFVQGKFHSHQAVWAE
jgi:prevent-host-death family protein